VNKFLEILRVQDARTCLKINAEQTMSLRLGINEGDEVMLGNKKIDQVDSFAYLGSKVKMVDAAKI